MDVFKTGNYFKVNAALKTSTPAFARYMAKIDAEEPGETFFLESYKKITTRNPEWGRCFGPEARVYVFTREDFVSVMENFEDSGRLLEEEGLPGWRVHRSEVRQVNRQYKEAVAQREHTSNLERWIERLLEESDWEKVKYELCVHESSLLAKWELIMEAARCRQRYEHREQLLRKALTVPLRYWQAQLVTVMEKHRYASNGEIDDRKVLWVYDKAGGSGKTWLAKYLTKVRPTKTTWLQNGATKDLMKSVMQNINTLDTVFFDLSRCNLERINWDALERIKNGMIMSTKYQVESCIIESPLVVCFANFEPDLQKLSADRWVVFAIEKDHLYSYDVELRREEASLVNKKMADAPDEEMLRLENIAFLPEQEPPADRSKITHLPCNAMPLKCNSIPPAKGRLKNAASKPAPSDTRGIRFDDGTWGCLTCFAQKKTYEQRFLCQACRGVEKRHASS